MIALTTADNPVLIQRGRSRHPTRAATEAWRSHAARRTPDFGSFLAAATNREPFWPRILGSDETTRNVANDRARELYPSIDFDWCPHEGPK